MKARVAVYFKDWPAAKAACEEVINSGEFQIVGADAFTGIWTTDSPVNSIFALAFSNTDNQNINGLQYIYRGTQYGDIEVLSDLSDLFEAGDVRGFASGMLGMEDTKIRNMGKFPDMVSYSDDIMLIRYEEVVLMYAEALFEINNADPEALVWLNKVPAERNATLYAEATKANIMLERRKELAFEGFRFDDLARTGSNIPLVDPLQTHGGVTYGSYKYTFPIPALNLTLIPTWSRTQAMPLQNKSGID